MKRSMTIPVVVLLSFVAVVAAVRELNFSPLAEEGFSKASPTDSMIARDRENYRKPAQCSSHSCRADFVFGSLAGGEARSAE